MRGRILVCGSAFCRRRVWCARPDKMWLWEESATHTHTVFTGSSGLRGVFRVSEKNGLWSRESED